MTRFDEVIMSAADFAQMYDETEAMRAELSVLKAEISHLCAEAFRSDLEALKVANQRLMDEMAVLKAPPKVLNAEEITEPGWYKVKFPGAPWTIVRIGDKDGDYSCCQFIGPIQMPEA